MTSKNRMHSRPGLLTWKNILPWQRDNEFILTGYRRASFSYINSTKSIFAIHNETANIWSHLLGAVFFGSMLYQYFELGMRSKEIRTQDIIALNVYNFSVTVCFVLSTIFHTFSDHSQEMHKFGNELDHLGIVLVMWGTGISGTHFAFYCDGALRNTYFAILSGTALGCGVFTLRPQFRKPAYRTMRFLMYCFLGASLFAPVVHGLSRFGKVELDTAMGLRSFLGLALINFTGAAVYAVRIPERWFPKTFDLLGQSHNWMHVLVLTGALVRLQGLLEVTGRWQLYTEQHGFCLEI
ncbi:HlyIII-domain-containing protein [Hypomontagnella submonticulosa]|nr:HlyIII-domain-containing protein [Hypomontagnella submonticulosa]